MNADPHDLQRFISAQNQGGTYSKAVEELRRGRKTSHWMWFVFPQIAGLGQSPTAKFFAIRSLDEAKAYLSDEVLAPRRLECARIVSGTEGRTAEQIFGGIDAMKLRSSMTLFHRAAPEETVFAEVLDRYFAGEPDPETDKRLGS